MTVNIDIANIETSVTVNGVTVTGEATTSNPGFMSAADKAEHDDLVVSSERQAVVAPVRNETGSTLLKGKLVAVSGYSIPGSIYLVSLADKDNPALRPAVGFVRDDILNNTNGEVIVAGVLIGFDTSTYSLTDQLILGDNGGVVRPPPDNPGVTGEVQYVASVSRVGVANGEIIACVTQLLDVTNADQVYALQGSSGIPSETNRYLTQSDTAVTKNTSSQTLTNKTISATDNTINDTSATLGDLLVHNGTKYVRLPKGTALQRLRVNAAGTNVEFADPVTTTFFASVTATTTTTSPTLVLLDSMTLTPGLGDYVVLFSSSFENTGAPQSTSFQVFVNGVAQANTLKILDQATADETLNISINTRVTGVLASQAIEIRWAASGGTSTAFARTFTLIKVA